MLVYTQIYAYIGAFWFVFGTVLHYLQFANDSIYTVEFQVVPTLNHAIILGIPLLHIINPSINWKTHTITW